MNLFAKNLVHKLLQFEIWAAVGLAGVSMAWPNLLPFAILGMGFFWVIRLFFYHKLTSRTPADLTNFIVFSMIPMTLFISFVPEKTILQVERLLVGIGLYYALVNWTITQSRFNWVSKGILAVGVLLALFAPMSVTWQYKGLFLLDLFLPRLNLILSDTVNPNVMAGSLALFFTFSLGLCLFGWHDLSRFEKILGLIAILVIGGMLVMTESRGAWLGVIISIAVLITLRWRWGWIGILALIMIGLTVGELSGWKNLINYLSSGGQLEGVVGRLEVWSRSIYMLQDFPFTGIGMGSFTEVVDAFFPLESFLPGKMEHAHSLFMQIGIDLGLLGLVGWLGTFILMFISSWKIYSYASRQKNSWLMGFGAGLFGVQVVLLIHGLFDSVLWGMVRSAPLVWFFWGVASAGLIWIQKSKEGFENCV